MPENTKPKYHLSTPRRRALKNQLILCEQEGCKLLIPKDLCCPNCGADLYFEYGGARFKTQLITGCNQCYAAFH